MKKLVLLSLVIAIILLASTQAADAANEPIPDGIVLGESLIVPNSNPYLLLQTTGPNGSSGFGDPYKEYILYLNVPAGFDKDIQIIIYDPETWETSASARPDERTGTVWDNMSWKVFAPDNSTIYDQTFVPNAITNREWINVTTIQPSVTGYGMYTIRGQDEDDDQSGFRLLITPKNDSIGREATLTFGQSAYEYYNFQGNPPPSLDAYYWAFVPSGTPYVVFGNFDLDKSFAGTQSITYFHPASNTTISGTPSDNNEWAYDNITMDGRWGYWRIIVNPGITGNEWALTVENGSQFVAPNTTDPTQPPYGFIGDRVWQDLMGTGHQVGGEPGVPGATVELYLNGSLFATRVTDANGYYNFTGLNPGSYQVKVIVPPGYNPTTPTTVNVNLAPGQTYYDADFGLAPRGSIGYLVWNDQSETQIPDPSKGYPSVNVYLFNSSNMSLIKSTITDINGRYNFTDLPVGNYTVLIDVPPMTTVTTNGGLPYINVSITSAAQVIDTANFGLKVNYRGEIGNTVWEDLNQNGFRDPDEPGYPGATVILKPPQGPNLTTTTDANGLYNFTQLSPGQYTVFLQVPSLYVPTTPTMIPISLGENMINLTANFGIYRPERGEIGDLVYLVPGGAGVPNICVQLQVNGSIVNCTKTDANGKYSFKNLSAGSYTVNIIYPPEYAPATPDLLPVTLARDEVNSSVDFGLRQVPPGSIGEYVWLDKNRNGVREPGEPGYPGVTVQLLFGTAVVETAVTDSTGNYSFTGLYPNNYTVRVIVPVGNISTTPQVYIVKLAEGQHYTQANFGLDYGGAITGMKFEDVNKNGKYDPGVDRPIPGWKIELRQNGQVLNTTYTDANGNYSFTGLAKGVYFVREHMHPGWKASTPQEVMVIVNANACPLIFHLYDDASLIERMPNENIAFVPESRIGGRTTYELDIHRFNPNFNVVAQAEFQWQNGVTYDFNVTYVKATNQVIYTVNGVTLNWTGPEKGFTDFAIRAFSGVPGSSMLVNNLVLKTSTKTTSFGNEFVLASASDGILRDILFVRADNLTGDKLQDGFTLTGQQKMTWNASNVPTQSNLAYQIKFGIADCGRDPVVNFGNYRYQHSPSPTPKPSPTPAGNCITGVKYYDKDCDGKYDTGEKGMSGVTIKLYDSKGRYLGSRVTDYYGRYSFTGLASGQYTVMEIVPKGYRATTPTSVKVYLNNNRQSVVNFGNVPYGKIYR